MPTRRRKASVAPPQVTATLTTYVDQQGTTLLVAAALRGKVRLFPVDMGSLLSRRVTERAQREAGDRAAGPRLDGDQIL